MVSRELSPIEALKISTCAHGIGITPEAEAYLTRNGSLPLSVHEYPTTGGVTLILETGVYINAPFDEGFGTNPEATLHATGHSAWPLVVRFRGREFLSQALLLPAYLHDTDAEGRRVTDTVFSHADRVRVSPVHGCSFSCSFCDLAGVKYYTRPLEQLLKALLIAKHDSELPAHHVLISGGTPSPKDYGYFDAVCEGIVREVGLPVDVMMPPRPTDPGFIDRLIDIGVYGLSINLEAYDDETARRVAPQKERIGRSQFAAAISRAVERTGGAGRVRSLILVGLEPEEETVRGVEFLARLGCDPVLSPFRPGSKTKLAAAPPPNADLLERTYLRSLEIVDRHGVKLGPRCIPCQHNTLTLPDRSTGYFYSKDMSYAQQAVGV